jgi:hypothetical protein
MARRLVVVLLASLAFACSLRSSEAPPEDVEKAAVLFFERLKSAQYEDIYKDAAETFKQTQARLTIVDNLKQIAAIGRILEYRRLSMTFEGGAEDRVATPIYVVIFDQASAQIALNFKDEKGEWKLVGFVVKQRGGPQTDQPAAQPG